VLARSLGTAAVVASLAACVYVPRTTEVYDEECRIQARQMTLDVQQVGFFLGCRGRSCGLVLVTLGAVTVASAVVSGSIVLAGNVVYWFEKRGRCMFQESP
jgi:hypothetical protein